MKKYESYKDSGVEWIGEIPQDWKVAPLKYAFAFSVGFTPPTNNSEFYDENGEDWITISDLNSKYVSESKSKISRLAIEKHGKGKVPKGSLLYSFKLSVGKVAFAEKELFTNEAIFSIFPNPGLELNYYYYCLPAILIYNANENIYGAKLFNQEIIKNSKLPVPPKIEQSQIARFLDHHTSLIDELIEKKQRLIQKLEEKRKSVINEAVTKGLNPSVRMKDSGIEWIGEIPEHWAIKRLRYLGKCQNGVSAGSEYFGEGDPFLSYSDVYKNESLPDQILGLAKSSTSDKENYSVLEGDIFFTRTSETVEEIGLSSVCLKTLPNAVFAGFLIRFRPNDPEREIHKSFSKFYFRSNVARYHLVKEMNLVTRASLSQELLKSVPVLLPPYEEQVKIGDRLDSLTNSIDVTIRKIHSSIEKLKEFRQSLISEAVTGKIDTKYELQKITKRKFNL